MAKIERTKSGKYRTRVYVGEDATGKKHWKSITHEDRRTLKLIASEYEIEHREYVDHDRICDCVEAFISVKESDLSPSTLRAYKSMLGTLKTSYTRFCALSVDKMTRRNIQALVDDLHRDGYSTKYIKNITGLISATITRMDFTMPRIDYPKSVQKELHEPRTDEIQAILAEVSGTRLDIPVQLGIYGLRRGEICALRFPDDIHDNMIHVSGSKVRAVGGKYVVKEPKNSTSNRYVPVDEDLINLIRKQEYVTDYTPSALSAAFKRMLKKAGIPEMRFHDLRHFFASYMHYIGVPDAHTMRMGGWRTDNVMKRVYTYPLNPDEISKIAVDKICSLKTK